MVLYERWQTTVQRSAKEIALREPGRAGRVWTFGELDGHLANEPRATGPVVLKGRSVDFIVGTLRAWRDGQIAVPLEDDVIFDPTAVGLSKAPPETAHVKTTSGSTGTPRHILFTAEQLAADADHGDPRRHRRDALLLAALSCPTDVDPDRRRPGGAGGLRRSG